MGNESGKPGDKVTTIAELKAKVAQFCTEREWDQFHSAKDLGIGLITEAAELLEHFRFQDQTQIATLLADPVARAEIAHELSDILFFVLRFAQRFDFDLAQAFTTKMARNAERYPVAAARGSNAKYDRLPPTKKSAPTD